MFKISMNNGRLYAVAEIRYKEANGGVTDMSCPFPLVGNTKGLEVGRTYQFTDFQMRLRKFQHNGRTQSELCMNVFSWKEA